MVLVIFRCAALWLVVDGTFRFKLNLSRASTTFVIPPPGCKATATLEFSPWLVEKFLAAVVIGAVFWICTCGIPAAVGLTGWDCTAVRGVCCCLREFNICRASCTAPPAPPRPRMRKRASFCPSFSLASWNPGQTDRETDEKLERQSENRYYKT